MINLYGRLLFILSTYQQANLSLSCHSRSAAFSRETWKSLIQTFWPFCCPLIQSPYFKCCSLSLEPEGLQSSRIVSNPPSAIMWTSWAWLSVMHLLVKFVKQDSVSLRILHWRLISALVTGWLFVFWVKTATEAKHKSNSLRWQLSSCLASLLEGDAKTTKFACMINKDTRLIAVQSRYKDVIHR